MEDLTDLLAKRWQDDLTDLIFGFCAEEPLFDEHLVPCGRLYRDADGWWLETW